MNSFFGKNPNNLKKDSDDDDSSNDDDDGPQTGSPRNGVANDHKEENGTEETPKTENEQKADENEKKGGENEPEAENGVIKTDKGESEAETREPEAEDTIKTEKGNETEPKIVVKPAEEEKKNEPEVSKEDSEKKKYDIAHYFFSFLNNDELNITLVGYFGKVLNHLLTRKQNEVTIIKFLQN